MKGNVLRIKDTFDNKFLKFPVVCKNVNVFNHLCVCFVQNFAGICFCKACVVYFLPLIETMSNWIKNICKLYCDWTVVRLASLIRFDYKGNKMQNLR